MIVIRSYRPEDAQALANIYYHTIHKVNCRDYSQEQLDAWAPPSALDGARWLPKFAKTQPQIATIDEQVVGFAELKTTGEIDCFFCHHEYVGRGVGTALMNALHQRAHLQGITQLFSVVSITALSFFEHHGFKTLREQNDCKNGVEILGYLMEKDVTKAANLGQEKM